MRAPAGAASPEQGVVVSLNSDGQGVLRDGKTVFVAGALPGETIRYLRRRFHKQHDEADLLEVLQASPDRVLPRCASFGVCGGCALQHMSPAAQIAAKQVEVMDALRRIGHVTPQRWLEPLIVLNMTRFHTFKRSPRKKLNHIPDIDMPSKLE